jgi:SAM-dependent methyltransferase
MDHIYPDFFAKYYDHIYHQIRDSVDHEFFMHRILETKGKVLEAGTGTGRFFSEAIDKGADIYGIDISPAMIDVLKSKIPAIHHNRVTLQNIINFHFNETFSLVIAPFRTFMHLTHTEDQILALENVYYHLDPGGVFIFDAFIPDLNKLQNGIKNQTDFEAEVEPGLVLRRITNAHSNLIEQVTCINFRFELDNGKEVKSHEWNSCLTFFFRRELEHLLKLSPFSKWEILGDYQGNPLDESSKDFIVVCHKS